MISVVAYQPEHLTLLKARASHDGEVPDEAGTAAVTLFYRGVVIAIFGGFFMSPGVVHVWGLLSDEIKKCPISFHKTCRQVLEFYEGHAKLRRVQADIRCHFMAGVKWARAMGFEQEGIMRGFASDGSDCYLYAKVIR